MEVCQDCGAPATVQVVIPAAAPWPCDMLAESCADHAWDVLQAAVGFHPLAYMRAPTLTS